MQSSPTADIAGASLFPDLINVLLNLFQNFFVNNDIEYFYFFINDQQGKIKKSLSKLIKYNLI